MSTSSLDDGVAVLRRFSRLYTRRLGLLHEGLLGGPLTLPEGRLVFELAQAGSTTASRLSGELALDPGYLSRLLRGLEARGLIDRKPAAADGRQTMLTLTPEGQALFQSIDRRSQAEVGALLQGLSPTGRQRLVQSLVTAMALLDGEAAKASGVAFQLRPLRIGDMGWIVHRQAVLYAQEYGRNGEFEALLAGIAASFIRDFDPAWENAWVAEHEGSVAGSVFLVRESETMAKLRMLHVEPGARGLGIGRRLVAECLGFARQRGYARITLWTNDILLAARRIYQAEGFRLVREEAHHSFGQDLVGQCWELSL
jgi:DNA-binding MarR family transcriptional regulator/GNAT superfamily N-acetyltransferase